MAIVGTKLPAKCNACAYRVSNPVIPASEDAAGVAFWHFQSSVKRNPRREVLFST